MGIAISCILMMLGGVSAVFGISFYMRNFKYSRGNSRNVLFFGIMAALWCISYGLIGVMEDLTLCGWIRMVGVFAIDCFLINETFLLCSLISLPRVLDLALKITMSGFSVVDFIAYARPGLDDYFRIGAWTTWYANPAFAVQRRIHMIYMIYTFLVLLGTAVLWYRRNTLARQRKFIFIMVAANLILVACSFPDTILVLLGLPGVSTSGIGAALCTVVVWYGATRLNYFDIRMGNVADKIIDSIDAGVLVFDVERRVIISNQYARRMIIVEKAKELRIGDFFAMNEHDEQEMFERSLKEELYSARFIGKRNEKIYSVRLNPLRDDYGDPFCFLCVFSDVTEEMRMIDRFELASTAKSRFLAQMSHEIRTPIHVILGMNEMILREAHAQEVSEYAQNIDSAGHTLLALINNILDFSKIEDGKMEIVPVKYDTATFINDLVNSVAQTAEAKELELKLDVDETLPAGLIGDDVRLSQVAMNLLTNAVKYTEKGSVSFSVKYVAKERNQAKIFFAVKDTGIGIRKQDIERIYAPFGRLEEQRNHGIEGTGLGISIVRDLLVLMKSELHVESVYGKGSSFSFTVAQEIADETPIGSYEKRVRESKAASRRDDVVHAPKADILVVDDNEMNLRVMHNLLKLSGIRPDLVSSGQEAIEQMKKKNYDIVFMDHMMPEMDGVETLHRLKEENLIPEKTTMIALTANAITGARERYLSEGFTDYLSKPIEVKRLAEALRNYLDPRVLEKIPEGESEVKSEKKENGFPAIEGIDWEKAYEQMPDANMLKDLLKTFCEMAPMEAKDLAEHYQKGVLGEDKEALNLYRIKVHAMKHSAAQIGAAELSEEAKALEFAARDQELPFIVARQEAFLAHYTQVAEQLKGTMFRGMSSDKQAMSDEALVQKLSAMETAMHDFDTTTLNDLSFELKKYQFSSDEIAEKVDALQIAIRDFDMDGFDRLVAEIRTLTA